MKRCFAIICVLLMTTVGFACATEEPMPQDTPVKAENVDMLAVDHRLYELGYRDAECNGELDEITVNALKKFQKVNGLEVSGNADEETVQLLLSERAVSQIEYLSQLAYEYSNAAPLKNGAYGDEVLRLQRALQRKGYFSGKSDGVYGDATAAAVSRFQLANGLSQSGAADGTTLMRLYEGEALSWDEFIESSCAVAGDSGDHVRMIQLWLKRLGHFSGECTGRYGEETQRAVRGFQMENGLEASGDVDKETGRALFSKMETVIGGAETLSKGSTDERIDGLCIRLNELGYGAHAAFDEQTVLALMKYQLVNDLPVTGEADEHLLAQINGEDAAGMEQYAYPEFTIDEEGHSRLARTATAMLGQMTQMDEKWNFVEYLCLDCGYPLPNKEEMNFTEIEAGAQIEAGRILRLELGEQEIYGVAAMDGAVIYQGDEGYIIISYLDMLEADRVYEARMEAEDAA